MPISEENRPITKAIARFTQLFFGSWSLITSVFGIAMFTDTASAMMPKMNSRPSPSMTFDRPPPRSAPTATAGPHSFSRPISTAPRLLWARIEEIEVGMIVTSDVATAIGMAIAGSKCSVVMIQNSTGTMTMPPPTPSSPARIPATTPVAISPTTSWIRRAVVYPSIVMTAFSQASPGRRRRPGRNAGGPRRGEASAVRRKSRDRRPMTVGDRRVGPKA